MKIKVREWLAMPKQQRFEMLFIRAAAQIAMGGATGLVIERVQDCYIIYKRERGAVDD